MTKWIKNNICKQRDSVGINVFVLHSVKSGLIPSIRYTPPSTVKSSFRVRLGVDQHSHPCQPTIKCTNVPHFSKDSLLSTIQILHIESFWTMAHVNQLWRTRNSDWLRPDSLLKMPGRKWVRNNQKNLKEEWENLVPGTGRRAPLP